MAKKIGRPPKPEAEKRQQIGVRTSPELKAQLEESAAKNGRSVAQEAEFRLVQSFEFEALLGDAETRGFVIEIARQIEAVESVTEKAWTSDAATYFATRDLISDVVKRSRPTPPNFSKVNALASEMEELRPKSDGLETTLQKCGVLGWGNALAQFAGKPSPLLERSQDHWHMPDEMEGDLGEPERNRLKEWLDEWRDMNERMIELAAKIDAEMVSWRIAQTSGKVIYKHITGQIENAASQSEPI